MLISSRLRIAALAALAALLAPPALVADTVAFTYAWPAGLDALVSFDGERVRHAGEQSRTASIRGSYRLTSIAVDDGLLLRHSEFAMEPAGAAPASPAQAELQQFMSRLGSVLPGTVVGPDGRIARFEGTDAMIEEFRAAFAELAATLPEDVRPRLERMLSQVMTREVVERRMVENWNRDVGAWAGAELEQGQRYESEITERAPMLGNAELPFVVAFEYQGTAACTDGAAEQVCVRLQMHTTVASEKIGPALAAFLQQLLDAGREVPEIRDVAIDTTVDLISEPATLLPHSVTVEKVTSMTVVQNGQPVQSGQRQRQVYRYTYR